jgi:hypothetical protein
MYPVQFLFFFNKFFRFFAVSVTTGGDTSAPVALYFVILFDFLSILTFGSWLCSA